MATKKIDSKKTYKIRLKSAVKVGQSWLRPSQPKITVSGATLQTILDAVETFEAVS